MASTQDQHASPSREGLDRLAGALVGEWRVGSVTRLGGGIAAATHALTLHCPERAERKLVLKRYPAGDATPGLEWVRLGCAKRVELPTPEPVALCGVSVRYCKLLPFTLSSLAADDTNSQLDNKLIEVRTRLGPTLNQ